MSQSRKRRGAETQETVAGYYRFHGWPFATSAGAGAPGRDVDNMPGLAPEVKGRRDFEPTKWARQAARNARGDEHYLVVRPDGYGPASVGDWLVVRRLEDDTRLLREAGYGDPLPPDEEQGGTA